jgi:phytoene dehydrogenase-like protein
MPNFDAIIIGTGQSGPALARRLVAAGWKVAIIERKRFGGNMCQHRLHPYKDSNRERLRCTCRTPRR